MAALTAASWTVTITSNEIMGRKRRVTGTLLLAGTDTYPTGGVPMPAIGLFGMKRQLDSLTVFGQASSITQYTPSYDKTNHKMQLYVSHDTAGATTLPQDEAPTSAVSCET